MPRRGENIYKRKDGRWEARYIKSYDLQGRAVYASLYARSYKEVKEKLIHHPPVCPSKKQSSKVSSEYKDILMDWLADKKLSIKESTFSRYYGLIHCYLIPNLGSMNVEMIENKEIDRLVEKLRSNKYGKHHTGLSAKTITDILSVVKASLRYASTCNYTIACRLEGLSVKQSHHEMRVLSREEQNRLLAFIFEDMDEKRLGIIICLYTGIRIGELCALKWADVDFNEQIIKVRHTIQRIQDPVGVSGKTRIIISVPKSQTSVRDIPISDYLFNILEQHKKCNDIFILSGRKDRPVEPRVMQYYFQGCLKGCGIDHANFHALRHTFATRCIEVGVDVKSLSEILGHSNVNITLNRYVHSSMEQKRANMQKLVPLG